jgi:hypothetical protein
MGWVVEDPFRSSNLAGLLRLGTLRRECPPDRLRRSSSFYFALQSTQPKQAEDVQALDGTHPKALPEAGG